MLNNRSSCWTILIVVFGLSRILYWAAGVEFLDYIPHLAWQIPDPALLKDRFLETIFYSHGHPPLFSAFLAFGYKLFGFHFSRYFFQFIFAGLGIVLTLGFFELLRSFGVRVGIALAVTSLMTIAPPTVLFENLLLYTYWEFSLLFLSIASLFYFLKSPTPKRLTLFFGILVFLICSRRAFNWDWMLMVAVVLWVLLQHAKIISLKKYLSVVMPLLLVALMPSAKNYFLYGVFSSSTWMGMSLTKQTLESVPRVEREKMVKAGEIPELAYHYAFFDLTYYPEKYTQTPLTGIPVLDDIYKSGGYTNYDNSAYLNLSHHFGPIGLKMLRTHPRQYLYRVKDSFRDFYLKSASITSEISENERKIHKFVRFFDRAVYGCTFNEAGNIGHCSTIDITFFLFPIITAILAVNLWRRKKLAESITLFYLIGNIVYFAILGVIVECCELYRYRFNLEPFYWFQLALILNLLFDFFYRLNRKEKLRSDH